MLDIQFFGLNPMSHHFTSLLFHATNTALLFVVLNRISGALWPSFATALVFGIHPLHVESVAWIAERKDVLSGFFFMLILWAYQRHAQRPCISRYCIVFIFLTCGLLAKPMLVTVPIILLLLDYWPLRRMVHYSPAAEDCPQQFALSALLYEKVPLVILAIASSIVTYFAQLRGGATPFLDKTSHVDNIANGLFSYAKYMEKLLWPSNLAVFYPRTHITTMQLAFSSLFIFLLTVAAIMNRKKWPFFFVGWFWFICSLIPVMGFVRIGSSAMSDRYTYIPAIGLFIVTFWFIAMIATNASRLNKTLLAFASVTVICVLSVLSARQVDNWKNSFTFV